MFYSPKNNTWFDSSLRPDYEINGNWPDDATEYPKEVFDAVVSNRPADKLMVPDENGNPVLVDPPPPTTEQIIQGFVAEIQKRLDDFAKTRGYDGIMSACTYATSTVPKFKAEGQYCVEARDETWHMAYQMLEEAGDTVPTLEDVFDQLPQLAWPN